MEHQNKLADIVSSQQQGIFKEWFELQMAATTLRLDLMKESELRDQSRDLLGLIAQAVKSGTNIDDPSWKAVKEFLEQIAKSRALQGFSPSSTATFVFSWKQAVSQDLLLCGSMPP